MAARYYLTLPDGSAARGDEPSLSFTAQGSDALAGQLQDALRNDALFERWRHMQDDPDAVDPSLGATDPGATVKGEHLHMRINLIVTTSLPGSILKHRMRLLAGHHWELRDVSAA